MNVWHSQSGNSTLCAGAPRHQKNQQFALHSPKPSHRPEKLDWIGLYVLVSFALARGQGSLETAGTSVAVRVRG
jgi:hypothetical protein